MIVWYFNGRKWVKKEVDWKERIEAELKKQKESSK